MPIDEGVAVDSPEGEHLMHAVSVYFRCSNVVCVHEMLKTTPVVAAGVAGHVKTLEDIVGLRDSSCPATRRMGSGKFVSWLLQS
jgi:hypothetical protein